MLHEERPDLKEQLEQRIAELEQELRDLANDSFHTQTEKVASVSEQYRSSLERFLAANSIAMTRASVRGDLMYVNQAFTDLLGYTRDEILSGKIGWTEITPPKWKSVDDKACAEIFASGSCAPFEKEFIHKEGHCVPVLVAVVATDTTGEDCFCFVVDLSDRKRKEAELKLSEAQFRLLAESIPQMVFTVAADGRTDYFNKRWFELTGVQPTLGFEKMWPELCHPDDTQRVQDAWDLAFESKSAFETDARYKRKDGNFAWTLVRALPMLDGDGLVKKWFGTCTDIDEHKRAEEEIRASEIRFRTLADAIPQIVWTADSSGKIDFFNHRWFEYTGLSIEQSLNDGWKLLIHPDDLPAYLSNWEQALKTGDTYEKDFRLKRAVGIKSESAILYRRHLCRAVALRGRTGQVIKWFATWTEIEQKGTLDHDSK
jgi:PAS domain S-box-containing protein